MQLLLMPTPLIVKKSQLFWGKLGDDVILVQCPFFAQKKKKKKKIVYATKVILNPVVILLRLYLLEQIVLANNGIL